MSGAKYFVWGSGRWREVDSGTGRVSGWARRPRFVFVRHGRLRVASHRRVLAALRSHAAGQTSAVALGPRLSVLSTSPTLPQCRVTAAAAQPPPCEHHHCCMHHHGCNNNNIVKSSSESRRDAAVQHAPDARDQPAAAARRPRAQHAPAPATRPPRSSSRDTDHEQGKKPDSITAKPASTTKTDTATGTSPDKRNNNKQRTHSSVSTETQETQETSEAEVCKELTVSEADVRALRSYVSRTHRAALERFDSDATYRRALFYAINPLVRLTRCPRAAAAALPHFAASLGLTPRSTLPSHPHDDKENRPRLRPRTHSPRSQPPPAERAPSTSKRISLRRKHSFRPGTDEENSTSDEERQLFKKSNKTRTSLKHKNSARNKHNNVADSSDSEVDSSANKSKRDKSNSEEDKVRQNGVEKRTSLRKRKRDSDNAAVRESPRKPLAQPRTYVEESDSSSEGAEAEEWSAKPPAKPPLPRRDSSGRWIKQTPSPHKARPAQRLNVVTTDTDTSKPKEPQPTHAVGKQTEPKTTHTISKRASSEGKEYSNLEDHAIVSWISAGDRARRVNGNAVWRELERVFPALAGRARSWHSLRNRYLRYVLPALSALRLPPRLEAALRAAAATGVMNMKSKRNGVTSERRNSIFKEPATGASSRRRPAPATHTSPSRSRSPSAPPHTDTDTASQHTDEMDRKRSRPRTSQSSAETKESSSRRASPARESSRRRAARAARQSSDSSQSPARRSDTDTSTRDRSSRRRSSRLAPPAPAPAPSAAPPAPRTRMLYNPKLIF